MGYRDVQHLPKFLPLHHLQRLHRTGILPTFMELHHGNVVRSAWRAGYFAAARREAGDMKHYGTGVDL